MRRRCCYPTLKGLRVTGLANAAAEMGGGGEMTFDSLIPVDSLSQLHRPAGAATRFQLRAAILKGCGGAESRSTWNMRHRVLQDAAARRGCSKLKRKQLQLNPSVHGDILFKCTLMHLNHQSGNYRLLHKHLKSEFSSSNKLVYTRDTVSCNG